MLFSGYLCWSAIASAHGWRILATRASIASTRPLTTANGIARHHVNSERVTRHWDDLLRVAGSLKLGVVSAHDLMRTFQGSGRNSSVARALAEYGRIGKTLHLLDLADDDLYRRSLLIQVNTGERRHGLARTVFQGRRGQLRQAYHEGQEVVQQSARQ